MSWHRKGERYWLDKLQSVKKIWNLYHAIYVNISHNLDTCWCEGHLNIFYAITLISRLCVTFKEEELVKEQKYDILCDWELWHPHGEIED